MTLRELIEELRIDARIYGSWEYTDRGHSMGYEEVMYESKAKLEEALEALGIDLDIERDAPIV